VSFAPVVYCNKSSVNFSEKAVLSQTIEVRGAAEHSVNFVPVVYYGKSNVKFSGKAVLSQTIEVRIYGSSQQRLGNCFADKGSVKVNEVSVLSYISIQAGRGGCLAQLRGANCKF
jgi:hypothetical protein